ncbi:uncharacterized protein LOC103696563 [Phoenix dactylifera]|uniref:Uncharacterized protein LOC103696563 n=1 Tax=Phoenix dactylifera TaxID=42345 RepID=A0A8B7BGT2_PHODC|nr:uncharacterized protein LOC103696563 [Phoenix dactylifera]
MCIRPLVLLENLQANLENALHNHLAAAFSLSCALLLSMFCPLFWEVLHFFSPLLLSTAVCSMAVYMFVSSEKQATREILLVNEEMVEFRVYQVYDEVNFSIYNDHIEMGCFLLKSRSGWDEDGERIVFAGRLEAGKGNGVFDEDVASLEVDSLAEGLWNCYFGRCSKWYHTGSM